MRQKRDHAEWRLQRQVAEYLRLALPELAWWTSIDHGADLRDGSRIDRARRGMTPGTPDIVIILPTDGRALWIELKAGDGTLSHEQRQVRVALRRAGCPYTVARTLLDVEDFLRGYVELRAKVA